MEIADTRCKKRVGAVYDNIKRISEAALLAPYDGGTTAIKQVNNIQAGVSIIIRYVYVASIGGECETAGKSGSRYTACFCDRAPISRCK